jgi:transposase
MLSASTRQKVGFFGAVSLRTGRLVTEEASTFNTETFHHFLCSFLSSTHDRILLILDNVSYHKARKLKPFFIQNQHRLQMEFLPPYSPELNPIERVWRITRRKVTHNRYFPTIEELRGALINQFSQWERPNESLRVLCANI